MDPLWVCVNYDDDNNTSAIKCTLQIEFEGEITCSPFMMNPYSQKSSTSMTFRDSGRGAKLI